MELTPKEQEIERVKAWILQEWGVERPDVLSALIKGPEYLITDDHLIAYSALKAEVDAGLVPILKRVDGEYQEFVATEEDIIYIVGKLNRPYSSVDGPFSIKGIAMHTHCPLDGHKYTQEVVNADE